jgi:hypothetical protein
MLDAHDDAPCSFKTEILPERYQLILEQSLYIDGLPLGANEAKALLNRMEKEGNKDHILYVRFNMNVLFVAPLHREKGAEGKPAGPLFQDKEVGIKVVRLSARMASVDFFEDEARTKLIYSFRP